MNLVSRLTPRPLKEWFRRFLHGGVQAVAAEEAAHIQLGVLDAQEKVLQKGIELARKSKPYRESDDELERELAQEFGLALRETAQLGRVMLGQGSAEDRQEVLSGPLPDSPGSKPSLPAG